MAVHKTSMLVLDCTDPQALARFYAELLAGEIHIGEDPDLIEVVGGSGVRLAVRRDHGHAPPSRPRPEDGPREARLFSDPAGHSFTLAATGWTGWSV